MPSSIISRFPTCCCWGCFLFLCFIYDIFRAIIDWFL